MELKKNYGELKQIFCIVQLVSFNNFTCRKPAYQSLIVCSSMSKRVYIFKNWISSSVNSCLTQHEPITQRCDSSFSTISFSATYSLSVTTEWVRLEIAGVESPITVAREPSSSVLHQFHSWLLRLRTAGVQSDTLTFISQPAVCWKEELKDFVSTICSTADFCDAAVELWSSVILAGCADKTPVDLHCFAGFFSSQNTCCDGIVLFQTAR